MQLYVVRHGIAIGRENPKCPPEADRYLTTEGLHKTRQVAAGVAALGISPDLFFSSPFLRAFQTAEIFARALGYPRREIRRTALLLPGSDPALFLRELAREKRFSAVFCFGHAPHLDALLEVSLGVKGSLAPLKKAGVALVEFTRVSPSHGRLIWLAPPRLLRQRDR